MPVELPNFDVLFLLSNDSNSLMRFPHCCCRTSRIGGETAAAIGEISTAPVGTKAAVWERTSAIGAPSIAPIFSITTIGETAAAVLIDPSVF